MAAGSMSAAKRQSASLTIHLLPLRCSPDVQGHGGPDKQHRFHLLQKAAIFSFQPLLHATVTSKDPLCATQPAAAPE